MQAADTPTAFGIVSRLNHWIGAALVLLMLGIGLYFRVLWRLLLVTVILHVLAALWHALVERNRAAMARMLGAPAR